MGPCMVNARRPTVIADVVAPPSFYGEIVFFLGLDYHLLLLLLAGVLWKTGCIVT